MTADVKIFKFGKFDINPRGKLWAEDETTFGHKLLKKMGWSKGHGLGKDLSGITENIKAKVKRSKGGIGYLDNTYLAAADQGYDDILASLNQKYKTSVQENNTYQNIDPGLEKRSKQFKNRIHYQKFIKNKDICRYSERDMKSIFLRAENKKKDLEISNGILEEGEKANECPTFPLEIYNSQINAKDYFAQKLKQKFGGTSKKNILCNKSKTFLPQAMNIDDPKVQAESIDMKKCRKKQKKMKDHNKDFEEINNCEKLSENNIDVHNIIENDSSEPDNVRLCTGTKREDNVESEVSKHVKNHSKKKKKHNASANICNKLSENNIDMQYFAENVSSGPDNVNLSPDTKTEDNMDMEVSKHVKNHSKKKKKYKVEDAELNVDNKLQSVESSLEWELKNSDNVLSDLNLSPQNCWDVNDSSTHDNDSCKKRKRHDEKEKSSKKIKLDNAGVKENESKNVQSTLEMPSKNSDQERVNMGITTPDQPIKLSKLQILKSCLKKTINALSFKKRVSFNENIYCKTIEYNFVGENLPSDEEISDHSENSILETSNNKFDFGNIYESDIDNIEDANRINDSIKNESYDDDSTFPTSELDDIEISDSCIKEYKCLDLPKSKKQEYNCWLEAQRQATKLKLYKNMIKNVKKHRILQKTNLLDIKGYGNWGF